MQDLKAVSNKCNIIGCKCVINHVTNRDFEIPTLLECYAAQNSSFLPKFQDNLSVPFSRVKQSDCSTLQDGTDGLCKKMVNNC